MAAGRDCHPPTRAAGQLTCSKDAPNAAGAGCSRARAAFLPRIEKIPMIGYTAGSQRRHVCPSPPHPMRARCHGQRRAVWCARRGPIGPGCRKLCPLRIRTNPSSSRPNEPDARSARCAPYARTNPGCRENPHKPDRPAAGARASETGIRARPVRPPERPSRYEDARAIGRETANRRAGGGDTGLPPAAASGSSISGGRPWRCAEPRPGCNGAR